MWIIEYNKLTRKEITEELVDKTIVRTGKEANMIEKIYFDMDGVLADFDRGIKEICHLIPLDQVNKKPEDDDKMWEAVKEAGHFYDMLEPMEGAIDMFNKLYEEYGEKVEILSGIPKPRRGILTSGEDKTNWAHRLLSKDLKVNIVYREEKKNYVTSKGCILVDDLKKNIDEWEAQGGNRNLVQKRRRDYQKNQRT